MFKARGFWMCNLTLPPRQKIFLQHYMEGLVLHSILFAILCESPFKSSVTVQLHPPSPQAALLLLVVLYQIQREHRFMGKKFL
jgi:hypothetical protein